MLATKMPVWILILSLLVSAACVGAGLSRERWPSLRLEAFPAPWRRWLALVLLVFLLALVVFAPLLAFPWISPVREDPAISFGELFLGHALLAGFLLVWWVLAGRAKPAHFLAFDPCRLADDAQLGAAAAAAGWTAMVVTLLALQALLPGIFPDPGESVQMPDAVRAIVALGPASKALLAVSAGVVEEAFFRSFLQRRLGAVLSVGAFVASHMTYGSPLMLVGILPVGAVFAWVFARRPNVVPCMVGHILFDAVQLFLFLPTAAAER